MKAYKLFHYKGGVHFLDQPLQFSQTITFYPSRNENPKNRENKSNSLK